MYKTNDSKRKMCVQFLKLVDWARPIFSCFTKPLIVKLILKVVMFNFRIRLSSEMKINLNGQVFSCW